MTTEDFVNILGIIFMVLVVSMIASVRPVQGYEISIYRAYPSCFWVFLIGVFACGIYVLVGESVAHRNSRSSLVAIFLLFSANLVLMLLPVARGYATVGRSDTQWHLGSIKDIALSGHVVPPFHQGENYYPLSHILVQTLSFATMLEPGLLIMIVPVVFRMLFIASVYVFSNEILSSRSRSLLATTVSSIPMFGFQNAIFYPTTMSFYLLPLALFAYYRMKMLYCRKSAAVLSLILFAGVFMHPGESTLSIAAVLLLIDFGFSIFRRARTRAHHEREYVSALRARRTWLYPLMILFMSWFTWASTFWAFGYYINLSARWLIVGVGELEIGRYLGLIRYADLSLFQIIDLLANTYGQVIVIVAPACVVSVFTLKKVLTSDKDVDLHELVFGLSFAAFIALLLLVTFNAFPLYIHRELRYVLFYASFVDALGFYRWARYDRRFPSTRGLGLIVKKTKVIIVVLILTSAASIGIFNSHPSPITKEVGLQITHMEISGTRWFLAHQDSHMLIDEIEYLQIWYAQAELGRENVPPNIRLPPHSHLLNPPNHFGYDQNRTYGQFIPSDRYFVDIYLSRIHYQERALGFESLWRFTPVDFAMLESDITVDRVCSNGEFMVYFVRSSTLRGQVST